MPGTSKIVVPLTIYPQDSPAGLVALQNLGKGGPTGLPGRPQAGKGAQADGPAGPPQLRPVPSGAYLIYAPDARATAAVRPADQPMLGVRQLLQVSPAQISRVAVDEVDDAIWLAPSLHLPHHARRPVVDVHDAHLAPALATIPSSQHAAPRMIPKERQEKRLTR